MSRPVARVRAVRPWEWALPPAPVHREVLYALPEVPTDKPPLLFVHGMGHGAWYYAEHWLEHAASRGFPTHAVSLRAHGGSGGAARLRRTLVRDYVHDVVQEAVRLPHRPVLVGHSLGALVVARALSRYPARAAVLLAPTGPASVLALIRRNPTGFLGAVAGRPLWLTAGELYSPALDPAAAAAYVDRQTPEAPLVQYQMILSRAPELPRGDPPVLVVGSRADVAVAARDVERVAARYGTEPVWLDGVGHNLVLEPGWKGPLDAILDWVDRLP